MESGRATHSCIAFRAPAIGQCGSGQKASLLAQLDRRSGIISGNAPQYSGEYCVTLRASNALGNDSRQLRIVVGDEIGLTPQMGWNVWYSYTRHITDQIVRAAAATMISSGLADYGYQYVDIDDCWDRQPTSDDPDLKGPTRDAQGNILPNGRFPDMRALSGYIHSLGLKTGIYSSPGPRPVRVLKDRISTKMPTRISSQVGASIC